MKRKNWNNPLQEEKKKKKGTSLAVHAESLAKAAAPPRSRVVAGAMVDALKMPHGY